MASDELKEIRKAMTKEAIREHQMARIGGTQTDLFTCSKCRKKNCTYTQVGVLYLPWLGPQGTPILSMDTTFVPTSTGLGLCVRAKWLGPAQLGETGV